MEDPRVPEFQLIFEKVDEARASLEPDFQANVIALQRQSDVISELLMVAREISEPQPIYFTRG